MPDMFGLQPTPPPVWGLGRGDAQGLVYQRLGVQAGVTRYWRVHCPPPPVCLAGCSSVSASAAVYTGQGPSPSQSSPCGWSLCRVNREKHTRGDRRTVSVGDSSRGGVPGACCQQCSRTACDTECLVSARPGHHTQTVSGHRMQSWVGLARGLEHEYSGCRPPLGSTARLQAHSGHGGATQLDHPAQALAACWLPTAHLFMPQ